MMTKIKKNSGIWLIIAAVLLVGALQAAHLTYYGKPDFDKGDDQGYFVWKDGRTWKVRWTTYGSTHKFTGSIHLIGGTIDDLNRVSMDDRKKVVRTGRSNRVVRGARGRHYVVSRPNTVVVSRDEDKVWREDGRTIQWTSFNHGGIDGFDFKVRGDVERIRFVMRVDSKTRRHDVAVGRDNVTPLSNPFSIKP